MTGGFNRLSDMTGGFDGIISPCVHIFKLVLFSSPHDYVYDFYIKLQHFSSNVNFFTGELSESQKEEIERSRTLTKRQETELNDLRQQMVKLSEIVDKQANEIAQLNTDHK